MNARNVAFAASLAFGVGVAIYAFFVWNNFPANFCPGGSPCLETPRPEYMTLDVLAGGVFTLASLG